MGFVQRRTTFLHHFLKCPDGHASLQPYFYLNMVSLGIRTHLVLGINSNELVRIKCLLHLILPTEDVIASAYVHSLSGFIFFSLLHLRKGLGKNLNFI